MSTDPSLSVRVDVPTRRGAREGRVADVTQDTPHPSGGPPVSGVGSSDPVRRVRETRDRTTDSRFPVIGEEVPGTRVSAV